MGKRQIGLALVLKKLGLPPDVDSFEDRLILQKAMYLARAVGIKLGYHYRWYLHGPYCPAVAEDGFAIKADLGQGINDAEEWELDNSSSDKLKIIQPLMGGGDRTILAKKLELYASVHFLIDVGEMSSDDPAKITETLKRYDKDFDQSQVKEAIKGIRGYGLIS